MTAPQPRTLALVRHGETVISHNGDRFCGSLDPPLTATGRAQAAGASRLLQEHAIPVTAGWMSPSERARETASVLCPALAWQVVPDLAEQDFGGWEGREKDDVARAWPELYAAWLRDPVHIVPPQGESGAQVFARVDRVIARIAREKTPGILVVSHKTFLRFLVARLIGVEPERARQATEIPLGGIVRIRLDERDATRGTLLL